MSEKIIYGYGSIPHLSTSKLNQQADKKISMGQEEILTKKARDWKDLIIVTEKLDGSNVAITKKDGKIVAVGRSGYNAYSSPYNQHHAFAEWVDKNKDMFSWIYEGYKLCGEWCYMVHGTRYDFTGCSPFFAFDLIRDDKTRVPYIDLLSLTSSFDIQLVPLLHIGQPISIKNAIKLLGNGTFYNGVDEPEGVVYQVERENRVDFLAKYVREGKEDGKFMHLEETQKGLNYGI